MVFFFKVGDKRRRGRERILSEVHVPSTEPEVGLDLMILRSDLS